LVALTAQLKQAKSKISSLTNKSQGKTSYNVKGKEKTTRGKGETDSGQRQEEARLYQNSVKEI
jgi:hypothetical protein